MFRTLYFLGMWKVYPWFKSYGNFTELGGFFLVVKLHEKGYAIKEATPSSFKQKRCDSIYNNAILNAVSGP